VEGGIGRAGEEDVDVVGEGWRLRKIRAFGSPAGAFCDLFSSTFLCMCVVCYVCVCVVVVCGAWCVVRGVWCVVCGAWCVVRFLL